MSERKGHYHFGEWCECNATPEEVEAAMTYIADLEAVIRKHGGQVTERPAGLRMRVVRPAPLSSFDDAGKPVA